MFESLRLFNSDMDPHWLYCVKLQYRFISHVKFSVSRNTKQRELFLHAIASFAKYEILQNNEHFFAIYETRFA